VASIAFTGVAACTAPPELSMTDARINPVRVFEMDPIWKNVFPSGTMAPPAERAPNPKVCVPDFVVVTTKRPTDLVGVSPVASTKGEASRATSSANVAPDDSPAQDRTAK
jgi:hypothetical protein